MAQSPPPTPHPTPFPPLLPVPKQVASYTSVMMETPVQWARAGPTYDEQPVFCWSGEMANNTVHEAHPECYAWEWQPMQAADIVY